MNIEEEIRRFKNERALFQKTQKIIAEFYIFLISSI